MALLLASCRFDPDSGVGAGCPVGDVCPAALCDCATGDHCGENDCAPVACTDDAKKSFAVNLSAEQALADTEVAIDLDLTALGATGLAGHCENLRFVDDGGEALPHWVEDDCTESPARVWVRVPSIAPAAVVYGLIDSQTLVASNGTLTFSLFDSLSDTSLWDAYPIAFQMNHDNDAVVGPLEGGIGALVETYASCHFAPYDGVGLVLEDSLDLGADSFCMDVTAATAIQGFDYITSTTSRAGLYIGDEADTITAQCSGRNCRTTGKDEQLSVANLTGIVSAALTGSVSDCGNARHVFRNLRLRRCEGQPPVAEVQTAFICP